MDIRKTNNRAAVCLFGDDGGRVRVLGRTKADWMRKHLGDVKCMEGAPLGNAESAERFFRTAGACVGELFRWGYRGCETVVLLWSELICFRREHLDGLIDRLEGSGESVLRFQCGAVGRLEALAEGKEGRFERIVRPCVTPHCEQPSACEEVLRREILERLGRSGVKIYSPQTLDVDDLSCVGEGSELLAGVTLRASVVGRSCRLENCRIASSSLSHDCVVTGSAIDECTVKAEARVLSSSAAGCTIERGAFLCGGEFRDCVIGEGSRVLPEGKLSRVRLGEHCRLGMCNELRDGVTLGAGVFSACGVRLHGGRAVRSGEFLNHSST